MRRAVAFAAPLLSGCIYGSGYVGTACPFDPSSAESGFEFLRVEPIRQKTEVDCGPAALAMVLRYYGDSVTLEDALKACPPDEHGVTAGVLRDAAIKRGYRAHVIPGTIEDLREQIRLGRPTIVGLRKPYIDNIQLQHYEVVVGIHPDGKFVVTVDPARGWMINSIDGFMSEWVEYESKGRVTLVIAPRKE